MKTPYSFPLVCANCQRPANITCNSCRLVLYCSAKCCKEHEKEHNAICNSPLMDPSWRPWWVAEDRVPIFMGGKPSPLLKTQPAADLPSGHKFLWGNMPAIDVLKLKDNEGEAYEKDLNILFAASGDLRNVVKTIAELPAEYDCKLSVFINDREFDVVARNAIFLLIALVVEDENEAVDAIIHLFYSAFITEKHATLLKNRIYPMIDSVCQKIKDKDETSIQSKLFKLGTRTLRLALKKPDWNALLQRVSVIPDLTKTQAQQIRTASIFALEHRDGLHRRMFAQKPAQRVCEEAFRQVGILLPMGWSQENYVVPNPTLFWDGQWHVAPYSHPIEGWSAIEVGNIPAGPANNDFMGQLYCYLQSLFRTFYRRISEDTMDFSLLNVSVEDLKLKYYTQGKRFDRIEPSNIADRAHVGVSETLRHLMPLLHNPSENPHATVITLFMTAVYEVFKTVWKDPKNPPDAAVQEAMAAGCELAAQFMGLSLDDLTSQHPKAAMVLNCANYVRDADRDFEKYIQLFRFDALETALGLKMKEAHTIVEKWPCKVKHEFGHPEAQEEFDTVFSSDHFGTERYVEWKKIKDHSEEKLKALEACWCHSIAQKAAKESESSL